MEENYQNEIYQNQQNFPPPAPTMSVGDWIGTLLLLMIPIANIILLFVWAFGDDNKPCRKNFAKAELILMAIFIGLYIIILIAIFSIFGTELFDF